MMSQKIYECMIIDYGMYELMIISETDTGRKNQIKLVRQSGESSKKEHEEKTEREREMADAECGEREIRDRKA